MIRRLTILLSCVGLPVVFAAANGRDSIRHPNQVNENASSEDSNSNSKIRRRANTETVSDQNDGNTIHDCNLRFLEQERLAGREVDLHGVEPCGTKSPTDEEMHLMNSALVSWKADSVNQQRRQLTSNGGEQTSYVVPVHLHVFKENEEQGALSPESQRRFVNTLNHGFRNSSFTFTLSGVTETINADWSKCSDEEGFKKALRVDGSDILNVYVCNLNAQKPGQIGYTYYPPIAQSPSWAFIDGVVIVNPDLQIYDEATVFHGLVHEVGHWMGLAHTFEGGCSTTVTNIWDGQASYSFSGDGVSDTPAHSGPTFRVSSGSSTCWQTAALDTCDDALGCDPGKDPVNNYMNIIPGTCYEQYGRFTPGQLERMYVQYETFRFRGIFYEITLQTPASNLHQEV